MENQNEDNNFLNMLLAKPIGYGNDWIGQSAESWYFVNPPKLPSDIVFFEDGLKEIITNKLEMLLEAQEYLSLLRKKRIKIIFDIVPADIRWFYLLIDIHLFSEYYIISNWVKYWLNIWGEIVEDYRLPIVRYNSKFSDSEILKAKNYPIENLYDGTLRKSGNKLTGLCPFHDEKHGSFFIFEDNHWHCFGACSDGGDSISFVMKLQGFDFPTAIRSLNGYY